MQKARADDQGCGEVSHLSSTTWTATEGILDLPVISQREAMQGIRRLQIEIETTSIYTVSLKNLIIFADSTTMPKQNAQKCVKKGECAIHLAHSFSDQSCFQTCIVEHPTRTKKS